MSEILETSRLTLRPWKADDQREAASLFRYASDPEIGLMCGWPAHHNIEESMEVIRNVFSTDNNWAIVVKDGEPSEYEGDPVGCIELRPLRIGGSVDPDCERYRGGNALELGYWIGRPFWGSGYMSEALQAVIEYAFDAMHADAVWGAYYRENARSGRVMEKCGMRKVGEAGHVLNFIGEYHDEYIRVITADEWWGDRDAS